MKTTNTFKKCCALVGTAILLATPNLFATISYDGTYTGTVQLYNNVGDEITAVSSGLGTFETFCLNQEVLANAGQVYNYVSSDNVIPVPTGAPNPDPIVLGTAWLYSQFRAGSLAGFVYGNAASANDLQAAIWFLQGNAGGANNGFVTEAIAAVGINNYLTASGGQYGVFALTLTDATGNYAQPVLGMVPEPSTVVAGVLLLLPFGVSTVRILRKNKAA